ncbi:MAG: MarR family transcriptional regulator [Actinobacteria bacterium]|nr:MarR family transcriptional regulator [Actinomycetota bacterium]MBV8958987.1 MarR family transcriptional regulator [Actinomycetota bacterium]MBV9254407.1 MarR family transcriptional regulator [Actinomycetota bacterium]MBV9662335.1 MarR family transcriptional regulator [Actinomycetota bacterium]MBV9935281.1 MarR family transcriptional regulator [Actinomycetota bacterium]
MAHVSDPSFLVLHALRLKGFIAADAVADLTGLAPAEVAAQLEAFKNEELATYREGRLSGWSLTPAGRTRHAELIAAELAAAACKDTIDAGYRDFLGVNQTLLGVCTDWQLRTVNGEQVVNDHTDAAHDKAVIGRLREVDGAVQPVCHVLAGQLARFSGYGPRLSTAVTNVENGDVDWFTKPLIDSYHTVWFEMHEDLLATLAIERAREGEG